MLCEINEQGKKREFPVRGDSVAPEGGSPMERIRRRRSVVMSVLTSPANEIKKRFLQVSFYLVFLKYFPPNDTMKSLENPLFSLQVFIITARGNFDL